MAVNESAKLNGAELIRELVRTGTADAKLALPRQILAFTHRKEKRVATAKELIDAMEKAGIMAPFQEWAKTPDLTLQKARTLAATGKWDGPLEVVEPTVEELLLAGTDLPPEPEKPAAEQAVDAADPFNPTGDCTLEDDLTLKPVKRGPGRPKSAPAPV
jgi:hypothetical protein